jgi:hypothetical protein
MTSSTVPTIQELRLENLIIDARYQRPLSPAHLRRLNKQFQQHLVGYILVSQRPDGSCAILDGQHRTQVLRSRGVLTARCSVYEGLTPEQEAEIFTATNRARLTTSAKDYFRARHFAGDPTCRSIQDIATTCGVILGSATPSHSRNSAVTMAYACVENIYLTCGARNLFDVFTFARTVWPDKAEALRCDMLYGLSRFLREFPDERTQVALRKKAQHVHPINVLADAAVYARSARSPQEGGYPVAQVLVDVYNLGRHEGNRIAMPVGTKREAASTASA